MGRRWNNSHFKGRQKKEMHLNFYVNKKNHKTGATEVSKRYLKMPKKRKPKWIIQTMEELRKMFTNNRIHHPDHHQKETYLHRYLQVKGFLRVKFFSGHKQLLNYFLLLAVSCTSYPHPILPNLILKRKTICYFLCLFGTFHFWSTCTWGGGMHVWSPQKSKWYVFGIGSCSMSAHYSTL